MIQKCVNHLNAHLLPSSWIAFIKLCDTTNQICFPAVELPAVFLYGTNSIWNYKTGVGGWGGGEEKAICAKLFYL